MKEAMKMKVERTLPLSIRERGEQFEKELRAMMERHIDSAMTYGVPRSHVTQWFLGEVRKVAGEPCPCLAKLRLIEQSETTKLH